jgi:cell division protein FtsL
MIRKWIPLWTVPVLIIFATGTVWLRLFIIRTTYSINHINQMMAQIRQQQDLLQVKVSALRSPRRLEVLAKTKFGFSQPKSDQVIYMKKRKSEG